MWTCIEKYAQKAQKSSPNLPKIDTEIEARQTIVKISKKVNLGIFSREHIFDQNRSKMTSKIQQKINAWKVSKNDTKRSQKWAQMAPEIIEKSSPKSLLKKVSKNNKNVRCSNPPNHKQRCFPAGKQLF